MVWKVDVPPVDLRAVCLVRAMYENQEIRQRISNVICGGRMNEATELGGGRLYIVPWTRQSRAFNCVLI